MKRNQLVLHGYLPAFIVFLTVLISNVLQAQQTSNQVSLRDFVIYGKVSTTIASSTIDGGAVGTGASLITTGGPTLGSRIYSGGTVVLSNNTKVSKEIIAGPAGSSTGQTQFSGLTLDVGTNGVLSDNLYINGNIRVANSTVKAKVFQPVGATYTGPMPLGGRFLTNPSIPAMPSLPVESSPTYTGGADIVGSTELFPTSTTNATSGYYNNMTLTGGKIVTFKGPGKFYFNSIQNSSSNTFVFDFQGQPVGVIEIYVKGIVNLDKSVVNTINGGSPSRVLLRTWGTGTAFSISQGASGGIQWQGTIYAFNGDINIGSGANASKVTGALLSNQNVSIGSSVQVSYAPFDPCNLLTSAGSDKTLSCDVLTVQLTGQGKEPSTNVTWTWSASDGGVVDQAQLHNKTITVTKPGIYILTIEDASCISDYNSLSDYAVVSYVPCVVGSVTPPNNGKDTSVIGAELDALANSNGAIDAQKNAIFQFKPNDPSKVLIDIITKRGQTSTVYGIVTGSNYGLEDTIYNGATSLILTGWYPIKNILKLKEDIIASKVSYVRPVYPALTNSGPITTGGDKAILADFVRGGYGLSGNGVKIGVLSDSYNNLNVANLDVDADELPGVSTLNPNPVNPNPVQVLRDYPFTTKTDEGRAMLEIMHDVAPGANLAFRTGFLTPSDFALGIVDLKNAGCNVIVDDITYITEPFFRPGVVGQAVSQVINDSTHYITAAGNYAAKSYEGIFTPSTTTVPPLGIPGVAHNFGSSIYQEATVRAAPGKPGVYTIVLQWDDEFYSLSNTSVNDGAHADYDLYAIDLAGNPIGLNRINIQGDPIEILTLVVNPKPDVEVVTTIRLFVVKASETAANVRFKFVVFRGDFAFANPQFGTNASTIVGQANVPEAITVGAIRYTNTPQYNATTMPVENFSSLGGTFYNGSYAHKPDLIAPDGVNTSVYMGTDFDPEGDGFKNFFGTSAAAPHVGGAMALLLEAKAKYTSGTIGPIVAKGLLTSKAKRISSGTIVDGYDMLTGSGLVQVDSAIRTMANPTPVITGVSTESNTIIIYGNYFTTDTKVIINGVEYTPTYISDKELRLSVPVSGATELTVTTPSIAANGGDGGEATWSFTGTNKLNLIVRADNKTKKFIDALPAFTSRVYKVVNGAEVLVTDPAELSTYGLGTIYYLTNATSNSNATATSYTIVPYRDSTSNPEREPLLKAAYNYTFQNGALTIEKLKVKVTPLDKSVVYGDHIGNINYNYEILDNISNSQTALDYLKATHEAYVPSNALAVVNGLTITELDNLKNSILSQSNKLSLLVSLRSLLTARNFTIENNKLVSATSTNSLNLFHMVDVNKQAILDFVQNSGNTEVNLYETLSATGTSSRGMVSVLALPSARVNGFPLQNLTNAGYISTLRIDNTSYAPVLNGKFVHQINGITSGGGGLVQLISGGGGLVQIISGEAIPLADYEPVVLTDGSIIANGGGGLVQLISSSGEPLRVEAGQTLTLENGAQIINGGGGLVQLISSDGNPITNGGGGLLQIISTAELLDPVPLTSQVTNGGGGLLQIISTGATLAEGRLILASGGSGIVNGGGGLLQIISGGGGLLQLISGEGGIANGGGGLLQIISGGGGLLQIISGGGGLLQIISTSNNGISSTTPILFDVNDVLESGNIGPMLGVNMVTGLTAGNHLIIGGAFSNPNLEVENGVGNLTISQASATITLNPQDLSQNYDGNSKTVGYTTDPADIPGITISYSQNGTLVTSPTNAGTYTVSATLNNSNYKLVDANNNIISVVTGTLVINKANAVISVTPYAVTYDALPHTATGTATGLNSLDLSSLLVLSATTHTNAGTYTGDAWSFTGNENYNSASGTVDNSIAKADAIVSVTGYSGIYDGLPHGASGTATGVNSVNLSSSLNLGATFTNVPGGTANWIFNGGTNYNNQSGSVAITISKANQTITFNPISNQYLGADPFKLIATSSSGLPVSFALTGPATLSGDSVYVTGIGTITVTATQSGNSNYNPATPVKQIFNVVADPCEKSHTVFKTFNSTPNTKPTTMWVTVKIKLQGQLSVSGDYIEFRGGTVQFNDISYAPVPGVTNNTHLIPNGRITANPTAAAPLITFKNGAWNILVPLGYSSSSDFVISGLIVNSTTGFVKGKTANTLLKGAFYSNKPLSLQWDYGMAAYQYTETPNFQSFTYYSLRGPNNVSLVDGTYRSGTPIPHIAKIVSGGTGTGGTNYSGNSSSLDNVTNCIEPAKAVITMTRQGMENESVSKIEEPLFSVAPNPAKDRFTISFEPTITGAAIVNVFQANGAKASEILRTNVVAGEHYDRVVSVGYLKPGIYVVQLINEGKVLTQKLVILR